MGLEENSNKRNVPTVTVKQGKLRGKIVQVKGRPMYCFKSVPYAESPIGKQRFKAPLEKEPWEGVLDATQDPPGCIQPSILFFFITSGSEDCLHLNIYTSHIPKRYKTGYPVMVFIHGGGFRAGSCSEDNYGPDYLVPGNDIILVTINYRLGLLGFLSCEDQSLGVPGNAGLKDQVLALKWIKENIKQFGGDPNNVTIFGQGAGAACVHLHILSPMSKGLFHKAIMQSGCALCPLCRGVIGTSKLLGEMVGCENMTEREIIEQLRIVKPDDLLREQRKIMNPLDPSVKWICSPVVEKQKNEPAFLPDEPINILRSGKYNHVPIIIGYTSLEGLLYDITCIAKTGRSQLISDFTTVIPSDINCEMGTLYSQTISKKIKEFYYRHSRDDPNVWDKMPLINLMTDVHALRGIHTSLMVHLLTSDMPIYYYKFALDTALNIHKRSVARVTTYSKYPGASHGDDMEYFFKSCLTPEITPGSVENKSIQMMVEMWTNFAKFENPTPKTSSLNFRWTQAFKNVLYCLVIDKEIKMAINPEKERMLFWDMIYHNDIRTKYY